MPNALISPLGRLRCTAASVVLRATSPQARRVEARFATPPRRRPGRCSRRCDRVQRRLATRGVPEGRKAVGSAVGRTNADAERRAGDVSSAHPHSRAAAERGGGGGGAARRRGRRRGRGRPRTRTRFRRIFTPSLRSRRFAPRRPRRRRRLRVGAPLPSCAAHAVRIMPSSRSDAKVHPRARASTFPLRGGRLRRSVD